MAAQFQMPTYDAQYFIDKFEKIPDEMWCTDHFESGGKHCALGHCGSGDNVDSPPEARELCRMFDGYLEKPVDIVNDFKFAPFNQPTPRARILAACRLLKSQGH